MGLDISSKSGLKFHIGYMAFSFMREECVNQIMPGFGQILAWAAHGHQFLSHIEVDRSSPTWKHVLEFDVGHVAFSMACDRLLGTYMYANGFRALWDLFICHSDCDGKLTAKQCVRLIKDLDRIEPAKTPFGERFKEFRELVHEAAKRNETLYFH